jgi:two-component system chemotaxis response regulator CheY
VIHHLFHYLFGSSVSQEYNRSMTKLLVVDDAPFIIEIIRHILKNTSYEIIGEAANGVEAIEMATNLRPDIILMDIIMPHKSGIDAAKDILKLLPNTKIIAFSTADHESMVMLALEAGCCDYVNKPFKAELLLKTLEKALDMNVPKARAKA